MKKENLSGEMSAKSSHTPGPWGGYMENGLMRIAPCGALIDVLTNEGKANASLIAAEPYLKSAL